MEDQITKEKLRKNAMRTSGISALRKIRKLVDNFEQQEHVNKKRTKVLLLISAIAITCLVYYFFVYDRDYQNLKLSYNKSLNVDCQNAFFVLPARCAAS